MAFQYSLCAFPDADELLRILFNAVFVGFGIILLLCGELILAEHR